VTCAQSFRCAGCGSVRDIQAEQGRIRLNRETDAAPACAHCGGTTAWVLVGSDSEFYLFWQREDVCRVGEHVATDVVEYAVALEPPRGWLREWRRPRARVFVRACPEHARELQHGWGGFHFLGPTKPA